MDDTQAIPHHFPRPALVARGCVAVVLAGLLLVAMASAADARRSVPHGFHGVFWGGLVRGAPEHEQDAQWALMARSGVESVRTVFSWRNAQPLGPGATDLAEIDRIVTRAARSGIKVLPVVIDTPDWAKASAVAASPPAHVGDYADFLRLLIARYGRSGSFWREHVELPRRPVREWQIWNEPHLRSFWSAEDWTSGYAALLKASDRAVKQADRGARVVMAALADYAWRHLAKLSRHDVRGHFDVAAFNLFTSRPANLLKGVRRLRHGLMATGAWPVPIYLTETTFPASKGRDKENRRASWQKAWETTDRGMARRVKETYRLLARERSDLRLRRVYWYTWSSSYSPGDLFEYGGLVRYDGFQFQPRPALRAYRSSARRYEGCTKNSAGTCR